METKSEHRAAEIDREGGRRWSILKTDGKFGGAGVHGQAGAPRVTNYRQKLVLRFSV